VTLDSNFVIRLAMVCGVILVCLPAAAVLAAPGEVNAPVSVDDATPAVDHRVQLKQHLIDRGTTQEEAALVVNALTDEDVRVLAENPNMLSTAETNSTWIAWAIFLAVVVAGVTLIAIANS